MSNMNTPVTPAQVPAILFGALQGIMNDKSLNVWQRKFKLDDFYNKYPALSVIPAATFTPSLIAGALAGISGSALPKATVKNSFTYLNNVEKQIDAPEQQWQGIYKPALPTIPAFLTKSFTTTEPARIKNYVPGLTTTNKSADENTKPKSETSDPPYIGVREKSKYTPEQEMAILDEYYRRHPEATAIKASAQWFPLREEYAAIGNDLFGDTSTSLIDKLNMTPAEKEIIAGMGGFLDGATLNTYTLARRLGISGNNPADKRFENIMDQLKTENPAGYEAGDNLGQIIPMVLTGELAKSPLTAIKDPFLYKTSLGAITTGVPTLIADVNSGKPADEVFADTAMNTGLGALFGATTAAFGAFPQIGTLAYQQLLERGGLVTKLAPYFAAASKLLNPAAAKASGLGDDASQVYFEKGNMEGKYVGLDGNVLTKTTYDDWLVKTSKEKMPVPDIKTRQPLKPSEQYTAAGMKEAKPELDLQAYHNEDYEFYDANSPSKQVYDQMGSTGASRYWKSNSDKFFDAIDRHMIKDNSITVIDLRFFTPEQIAEIETYVYALAEDQQARVWFIRFPS